MRFSTTITDNPLKAKLTNGQAVLGTWVNNLRDPILVKMIAACGFDFVSLDMEHGSASTETIANSCLLARECGLAPLVRVYDPMNIRQNARVVDIGASGLIFPDVTSKEMAQRAVNSVRYFNNGTRNYSDFSLATSFTANTEDDMKRCDEQVVIVIMIEGVVGVEKIDEILSVPGIDVVFVGRGDLAHDMGFSGRLGDPKVNEMVDVVADAVKRRNIAYGLMVSNAEQGVSMIKKGVKFIHFSNEQAILMNAYNQFVKEMRDKL